MRLKFLFLILAIYLSLQGCSFFKKTENKPNDTITQSPTLPVTPDKYYEPGGEWPGGTVVESYDVSSDTRILATAGRSDDCRKFNDHEATQLIRYENQEKGISVAIPYNPAWGDNTYKVNPYDETENGIEFGPIFSGDEGSCGWHRLFRLSFDKAESSKTLIQRINETPGFIVGDLVAGKVEQKNIHNFNVVEYFFEGMCGGGGFVVIGKKYNYNFSRICAGPNPLFEKMLTTLQEL